MDPGNLGFGIRHLLPMAAAVMAGHVEGTGEERMALSLGEVQCLGSQEPILKLTLFIPFCAGWQQLSWPHERNRGEGRALFTYSSSQEPSSGLHTTYLLSPMLEMCSFITVVLTRWKGEREEGIGLPGATCSQKPNYSQFPPGFGAGRATAGLSKPCGGENRGRRGWDFPQSSKQQCLGPKESDSWLCTTYFHPILF